MVYHFGGQCPREQDDQRVPMSEPPKLDYQAPQRKARHRSPKAFVVALIFGALTLASLRFAAVVGGGGREDLALLLLDVAGVLGMLTLLTAALAMLMFMGGD
jgi:hypothetical protein